ncbi:hypothetical protein QOZ80_3AG0230570 [Eleusine coracana subsp. coracana]|nr:hypothetical protein QOZ80_3AG0230570 [Eleusine coracana subsp. coracana]
MIATAQAFAQETQGAPSAPDLQKRGVTKGFLSDWWSVFWDSFSSGPGDSESEHPEGYVPEEKPLKMGDDFGLEEEQMLQRAATLECSDVPQQDPVGDSAFYQRFLGHAPIEITAPGLMQRQYQQPTDGKGSDDMIDLSRDLSAEKTMGIAIEEVFRLKASHNKIFCCSFSSDGELLGSAGDENKVFLRNLRNNLEGYAWEAHSSFITDMRFQPNKSIFATASSDKTVRLWDTSQDDHFIHTFVGHSSLVRSVDFHPKADSSLLCSCDDGGKVLFWKIGNDKPHKSGATGRGKVRFDPTGSCLASVIGNTVNVPIFRQIKGSAVCRVMGITKLCTPYAGANISGAWLLLVTIVFHPKYPNTLVIGGYQMITLWNFAENKVVSVQPHDGYVADLAGCHATGMLASASHDGCVKVWR